MPAIRLIGTRALSQEALNPGDVILTGESLINGANSTVGNSTLTAAQMACGVIYRTNAGAAFTDTFDTSANLLIALSGNSPAAPLVTNHCFRLRVINATGYVQTLALDPQMIVGVGNISAIAATSWRDFVFTFLSVQPAISVNCSTVTGSKNVTFVLPNGVSAIPMGVSPYAVNISTGEVVTGTGIAATTIVQGLIQGQGGLIGCTLNNAATATNASVSLTFSAAIRIDGIGGGSA